MSVHTENPPACPPASDTLERIAALADEWKLASLQPQITTCRHHLRAHNGIDVAVFGRFKAGKSSFLNHLTGRAILPIGVVPLTAVITRLRFGEKDHAQVRFLNGAVQPVPLEEIGLYVGEAGNPNNQKQVAVVEVALPELRRFAPLQFVDTPGLGSAFAHNTEVALNWLPNVGAALVAVSSDAPLSERDLALLEELRRHTPKIVLLLTKADLLSAAQRVEVLSFIHGQFPGKEDAPPVFFYSVRPECAALKTELEQDFLFPLVRHRSEAANQIAEHKLRSLVNRTLDYLRVALAAATQAETSRQSLHEELSRERRQFDLLRAEFHVLSREWSVNALEFYLRKLHSSQTALQSQISTELRRQFPGWKLRLPQLLGVWRQWLETFLKRELNSLSHEQQSMFCEPLRHAQTHLTRTLRSFHDRLAGQVKSALGVSLTPPEFVLEVHEPTVPPVHVAYAFDAAFTSIGRLIPMTLFRKPVKRVLLRKARYEVEKNLSRLAADWRDRVAKVIADLTLHAERQALEELTSLEQTLAQTQSGVPHLRQIIADLESYAPSATMLHMNELCRRIETLLQETPERDAALSRALDILLAAFHSETGTIHRLDHQKQLLHLAAQAGLPPQLLEVVKTIPVGKGIAGQTVARGGPVTMCNLQTDQSGVARPGAKQTGVGGALCVPLRDGDRVVGTIGVGTKREYEYTPAETQTLEEVGRIIGRYIISRNGSLHDA